MIVLFMLIWRQIFRGKFHKTMRPTIVSYFGPDCIFLTKPLATFEMFQNVGSRISWASIKEEWRECM